MNILLIFSIAFFFSFIGTIPPGTLNLSVLQLGLEQKMNAAWRFAFAGAIIEYGYAWIAVEFETLISDAIVEESFQLIAAVVMLVLGVINLINARRPPSLRSKIRSSGFRRGLILGILNPLALPFWVAMTAYLKSQNWIVISSPLDLHAYLLGIAAGGFALLILFALLAKKIASQFQQNTLLNRVPGITLILLGLYAVIDYYVI